MKLGENAERGRKLVGFLFCAFVGRGGKESISLELLVPPPPVHRAATGTKFRNDVSFRCRFLSPLVKTQVGLDSKVEVTTLRTDHHYW